jgi:hypothetical protein
VKRSKQNKTKPDGSKSDEVGDLNNNKKTRKSNKPKKKASTGKKIIFNFLLFNASKTFFSHGNT